MTTDERDDRRVRRTKRRLKEALLALIEEGGYERVTIEAITRRADVGRSTFYSHFASKEDLLFSGFDHWLLSLAESAPAEPPGATAPSGRFRFARPLLEHISSQRRFFLASIVQGADAGVRRKVTALLVELVLREMARERPDTGRADRRAREGEAHAVVGAFLGLTAWWLSGTRRLVPAEVDEIFQAAVGGP